MRTYSLTFLLFLLSTVAARAQSSLLYEVSGNDLEQPSYLFGTIHLMCPENIRITDMMKEKLLESEQLVLEIDMDEPGVMQEMQQKMMLPDGQTIQDLMTEAEYQRFSQFMQDSLNLPAQMLARFNPIALYAAVATKMLGCQPGSYEGSLMALAQKNETEVLGLETIDEQIAAFNNIPQEEQVAYLNDALANYEESAQEFGEMLKSYMAEDVEELYELSHASMAEFEDMEQHLLIDRNRTWVPEMEELMDQSTFFAVGAAHLGGDEGLLKLLEEAGYTVTALAQ